jgi:protoporphyrinogen IX oxidase
MYEWVLVIHIVSLISWMAALFYLPRVMVYHLEYKGYSDEVYRILETMEYKLQRFIMLPAMVATLLSGLTLLSFGVVDWSLTWPWVKAGAVFLMLGFHGWLSSTRRKMADGDLSYTGKQMRVLNEVPTILLIIIVISVIIKY